jgi:hypothetical protein
VGWEPCWEESQKWATGRHWAGWGSLLAPGTLGGDAHRVWGDKVVGEEAVVRAILGAGYRREVVKEGHGGKRKRGERVREHRAGPTVSGSVWKPWEEERAGRASACTRPHLPSFPVGHPTGSDGSGLFHHRWRGEDPGHRVLRLGTLCRPHGRSSLGFARPRSPFERELSALQPAR